MDGKLSQKTISRAYPAKIIVDIAEFILLAGYWCGRSFDTCVFKNLPFEITRDITVLFMWQTYLQEDSFHPRNLLPAIQV